MFKGEQQQEEEEEEEEEECKLQTTMMNMILIRKETEVIVARVDPVVRKSPAEKNSSIGS